MKVLIYAFLLAAVVFQINSQRHNISFGKRQPLDKLVFNRTVAKSGTFLQITRGNVTFKSPLRLTFINVTDNYQINGGYATLSSGGPGYINANLTLKSQRNYGFNFTVLMYGR